MGPTCAIGSATRRRPRCCRCAPAPPPAPSTLPGPSASARRSRAPCGCPTWFWYRRPCRSRWWPNRWWSASNERLTLEAEGHSAGVPLSLEGGLVLRANDTLLDLRLRAPRVTDAGGRKLLADWPQIRGVTWQSAASLEAHVTGSSNDWQAVVTGRLPRLHARGVDASDLNVRFTYQRNQRLFVVHSAEAQAAGGKVVATGRVDVKPTPARVYFRGTATDVDVARLPFLSDESKSGRATVSFVAQGPTDGVQTEAQIAGKEIALGPAHFGSLAAEITLPWEGPLQVRARAASVATAPARPTRLAARGGARHESEPPGSRSADRLSAAASRSCPAACASRWPRGRRAGAHCPGRSRRRGARPRWAPRAGSCSNDGTRADVQRIGASPQPRVSGTLSRDGAHISFGGLRASTLQTAVGHGGVRRERVGAGLAIRSASGRRCCVRRSGDSDPRAASPPAACCRWPTRRCDPKDLGGFAGMAGWNTELPAAGKLPSRVACRT